VIARLAVVVWICLKCGLIQWAPTPCIHCRHRTVKYVIDDAYLTD